MWDIYCRQRPINDPDGKRLSTDQIYGSDPNLENHYNFAESILDSIRPSSNTRSPLLVLVGSYVSEWFGPATSIVRNGVQIPVYRIDHPEYLKRWASRERLLQNHELIQQIADNHTLTVTNHLQTFRQPKAQHEELPTDFDTPSTACKANAKTARGSVATKLLSKRVLTPEQRNALSARVKAFWDSPRGQSQKARYLALASAQMHEHWDGERERSRESCKDVGSPIGTDS